MADLRLFIAVELSREVRELLAAVQRDLAAGGADVKWSAPENIHLTLKFLGDTPEAEVTKLSAALDEAAAGCSAHVARLSEVGAFPDARRPRTIWVGLDEPTGQLAALQKSVERVTGYLVPPDPRGFTPHLTLGRTRSGRNVRQLSAMLDGYRLTTLLEVPVAEVLLIRSVLGRGGPAYTTLHRSPLGG